MELLNKVLLTLEELKIVEVNKEVEFINVTLKNREEYSIYTL